MTDSTDASNGNILELSVNVIDTFADIITIVASAIAIYLFVKNREKIAIAINTLLNYSNQISLADLKNKIERLNDYNATDDTQRIQVVNILHEIEGQINGNSFLSENLVAQKQKIETYINDIKKITEPKKRSLVSELRESIRTLDVNNFNNAAKIKK